MNINFKQVEQFSKEMVERGIGNFETGFSCSEALVLIEKLNKQDEIIKNLISLVEHYCSCYNHDPDAYQDYRLAKKYVERA